MGTLFGFIAKDITEKSRILQEHKVENPEQFVSVQSMVEYEVSNDLTRCKTESGLLSGSRTLLRLHRSLLFFSKFLERLPNIDNDARCSDVATEVYGETLGKFHPWLIRQAAYLAMKSLPIKRVLIQDYIKQSHEEAQELVPLLVKAMLDVYDVVQNLYAEKDLLKLPWKGVFCRIIMFWMMLSQEGREHPTRNTNISVSSTHSVLHKSVHNSTQVGHLVKGLNDTVSLIWNV